MLRLALPTQCAVCRGWSGARVCAACRARYTSDAARCERCALPVPAGRGVCAACVAQPPPFERCIAAVDYAFPWDALVADFKFRDGLDLTAPLGQLLAEAVAGTAAPRPDALVPLPLGPARLAERGYNQAHELARSVGRTLGLRIEPTLLDRLVDTPHQASLPRERRAANVRGTFGCPAGSTARARGRRLALVDDVMTTGASAAEAARVLLAAGAHAVQLWVLARTPAPEDR